MSTTKDIGALIIRIGFFGAQYTIMIIRNPPQTLFLIAIITTNPQNSVVNY